MDLHELWITRLPVNLPLRVLYFVLSYLILCFGIALSKRCKLPIVPTDLFPREVSDITKVPYSRIKIGFDVTCLMVTALLTFLRTWKNRRSWNRNGSSCFYDGKRHCADGKTAG